MGGGEFTGEQHFAGLGGADVFHSGCDSVQSLRFLYSGVSVGQERSELEQRNVGITCLGMEIRAMGSRWMRR